MRERMAEFTDGNTRLIGGSADTLYIPGRHRLQFMDTLALFLETGCFLEIATPTTVHLVVPPQEPILFVDHVCYTVIIYQCFILTNPSSGGSGNRRSTLRLYDKNGARGAKLILSIHFTGVIKTMMAYGERIQITSMMCATCCRSPLLDKRCTFLRVEKYIVYLL